VTFDAIFVPDELRAAVSDAAWLQAMLDFEGRLARAEARAGVIPEAAATLIGDVCDAELFDPKAIAVAAVDVGAPAEPLVRAIRERVSAEAADYVHHGATTQDVMDTAAALVAKRALGHVLGQISFPANACSELAKTHRRTVMAGRTLLQQAVPITFGLKAAEWLVAISEARARLRETKDRLAVEFGGAAGTLAALGDKGVTVLSLLAEELKLVEPAVPWHTSRARIAEVGNALAVMSGALAKVALDIALLEQTEVAEVSQPAGKGGSSTMPQKRNPVGSALTIACAKRVSACASLLTGALVQEHERSVGAWQAEWPALSDALALTAGAAGHLGRVLDGLQIDAERMRANLSELTAAEQASFLLAPRVGRSRAHELVAEASRSSSFHDGLRAAGLSAEDLELVRDPDTYLGSTEAFIERALARYLELG
jgi:3-carboxy-cis,cis-muconate cycloisomerase